MRELADSQAAASAELSPSPGQLAPAHLLAAPYPQGLSRARSWLAEQQRQLPAAVGSCESHAGARISLHGRATLVFIIHQATLCN